MTIPTLEWVRKKFWLGIGHQINFEYGSYHVPLNELLYENDASLTK